MSRTIKELPLGTLVYVNELIDGDTVPKPYTITRVNSNNTVEIERNKSPYTRRINATNNSVYTDSEMDTHLNDATDGFKARLSAALQSCLQLKSISTYTYGDTEPSYISRSIFLYSRGDYFLSTPTVLEPEDNKPAIARMTQAATLSTNDARKCYDETDTAVNCWLRSPYSAYNNYYMYTNGTEYSGNSNYSCGFRPVLCLSGDTIVSPEGTDTIMVLPEEKEYNEIDFSIVVGSREEKPSTAFVSFDAVNLFDTEAYLCVNANSENEVWFPVENGVDTEVPDCVKTTDQYNIAFKFYGKAISLASIDEPVIYVN